MMKKILFIVIIILAIPLCLFKFQDGTKNIIYRFHIPAEKCNKFFSTAVFTFDSFTSIYHGCSITKVKDTLPPSEVKSWMDGEVLTLYKNN